MPRARAAAACGRAGQAALLALLLLARGALAAAAEEPGVELEVVPDEVTVGERVRVRLAVTLPEGWRLDPPLIGPEWGPFGVVAGAWGAPEPAPAGERRVWSGELDAFRPGDFELPSLTLRFAGPAGPSAATTRAAKVRVRSVLTPDEREGRSTELADIKPPVSMPPDYRPLWTALAGLLALAAVAALIWWAHRRWAAKLAAAALPSDPFQRVPPHRWVYGELQRLLERRLPEQGEIELFYRELARILKRYLGGRYRVELMELTTEEVPGALEQAGTPRPALVEATGVLRDCDRVKFAREEPAPEQWKLAVEGVYRVVDRTKPIDAAPAAPAPQAEVA